MVVTKNFTDRTSIGFNGNGLRHSEAMQLVERFTRVDGQTIQWDVTIEDPTTYTMPFKMARSVIFDWLLIGSDPVSLGEAAE